MKAQSVKKAERVPPTPETVLKLRKNYLWDLEPALQQAAIAIAAGYRLITSSLEAKAQLIIDRTSKGSPNTVLSQKLVEIEERYNAWRTEVHRRGHPVEEVLDMVVTGEEPWAVDRDRGWRQGRAAELLIETLNLYGRQIRDTQPIDIRKRA